MYNRLRSLDFSEDHDCPVTSACHQIHNKTQDDISMITKKLCHSECPPRSDEDPCADDDSMFSFTDLDAINSEINSFVAGLQRQTKGYLHHVNSKVSFEIENLETKINHLIKE